MKKFWFCVLILFVVSILAPFSFAAEVVKKTQKAVIQKAAKFVPPPAKPVPVVVPPSVIKVQEPVKPIVSKSGWYEKMGLVGGSGMIEIGYYFPIDSKIDLNQDLGYGIGKDYYIVMYEMAGRYKLNPDYFIEAAVDLISYSDKVKDIPGLSGAIDSGNRIGYGLAVGRNFGKWSIDLGYNAALGLIARGGYDF